METKNEDDLIYFYISRNNATERDDAFFMFRFTFEDEINYKKYNIQNSTLKVTKKALSSKTFNYTIELTPMDDWSRYNLAYIARIIESEMPNKSFLSLKPVHRVEFAGHPFTHDIAGFGIKLHVIGIRNLFDKNQYFHW